MFLWCITYPLQQMAGNRGRRPAVRTLRPTLYIYIYIIVYRLILQTKSSNLGLRAQGDAVDFYPHRSGKDYSNNTHRNSNVTLACAAADDSCLIYHKPRPPLSHSKNGEFRFWANRWTSENLSITNIEIHSCRWHSRRWIEKHIGTSLPVGDWTIGYRKPKAIFRNSFEARSTVARQGWYDTLMHSTTNDACWDTSPDSQVWWHRATKFII